MNPRIKKILCVVVVALLAACGGLPKHKEISTDNPSILEVIGAPEGAEVWSGGNMLGTIEKKKVRFTIASGVHKIRIVSGSAALYDRDVFVEKGTTRQINLKTK